jgi:hypothetical protein
VKEKQQAVSEVQSIKEKFEADNQKRLALSVK